MNKVACGLLVFLGSFIFTIGYLGVTPEEPTSLIAGILFVLAGGSAIAAGFWGFNDD